MSKQYDNNKRRRDKKTTASKRQEALNNLENILSGASFGAKSAISTKGQMDSSLRNAKFSTNSTTQVANPNKNTSIIHDEVLKLEAQEIASSVKRVFCSILYKSFFIWSKKENAWDRELATYADSDIEFVYDLRMLIDSLDVSKIANFIHEKDKLLKLEVEDVNCNNKSEIREAVGLILEEGIKRTHIDESLDVLKVNRNIIYECVNNISTSIVSKLLQNNAVKNWDTKKVLKLLISTCIFVDQDLEPKYLVESKLQMINAGVIRNLIGYKEWFSITHSVMFQVINELIKDNPKEKISTLIEEARSFNSRKSLKFSTFQIPHHAELKDTLKVIDDYLGIMALVLPSVESYVNLDEFNKLIALNHWMQEFPYKELNKGQLLGLGYVYVCVRDKENNVFNIFYDTYEQKCLLAFSNKKFLDSNDLVSEAMYSAYHMEENSGIRNSKSVWISSADDMFFSCFDIYAAKDSPKSQIAKDGIDSIGCKGLKVLTNIDYRYTDIFESLNDGSILCLVLDEHDERVHFISKTKFFIQNMDKMVHDRYGYHNVLEEYFENNVDIDPDRTLIVEMPLNEKFGYVARREENNEELVSKDDDSDVIIKDENAIYREKILRYIRHYDQKKLLTLSWVNEFFKPYGGIVINESEGAGSHYKIRLSTGVDSFWTVSKFMREEGIFISSIIEIIDSFKLSYKDVYEKCIQPNIEKDSD